MSRTAGYSTVELVLVVLLVSLVAAISIPPLGRMRERAAVDSGRSKVTAALWLSRSTGARWGRTAVLEIDAEEDVMIVLVDTASLAGSTEPVVVREFQIGAELGVDLQSNRSAICFNSRGVGTTSIACPSTGALITLTRNGQVDTVRVNSAGRVW